MPLEIQVVTPENIVIRWSLAGPVSRAVAFLNDLFYQFLLILIGTIFMIWALEGIGLRQFSEGILTGFVFFLFWGYHTFFEVFGEGRTPGKRQAGIRVVSADGFPVEFFPSLIRNLLRLIDFLPFGFLTGLFVMLISSRQQRLGDMLAGTMVIYDPPVREPWK